MSLCKFAKYQIDLLMAKKMVTQSHLMKQFISIGKEIMCRIMKNDPNYSSIKAVFLF